MNELSSLECLSPSPSLQQVDAIGWPDSAKFLFWIMLHCGVASTSVFGCSLSLSLSSVLLLTTERGYKYCQPQWLSLLSKSHTWEVNCTSFSPSWRAIKRYWNCATQHILALPHCAWLLLSILCEMFSVLPPTARFLPNEESLGALSFEIMEIAQYTVKQTTLLNCFAKACPTRDPKAGAVMWV